MDTESVSMFMSVTSASDDVARGFLSLTNGDVERAIELFFEDPTLISSVNAATSSNAPPVPNTTRPNIGRRDSQGVIHIDSDEDDFMQMDDDNDSHHGAQQAARVAARAQQEEDEAMAKRLQEEMYGSGGPSGTRGVGDGEDVRAPIARTTETLVAPDPAWADDDGPGIFNALPRRRPPPGRSGGPFGQHIWSNPSDPPSLTAEDGTHARRLEDLFRPPYDIMERGLTWDDARSVGKEEKKWIMVNLQDMSDFNCQALNRDIWKDSAVKALVKENFLFLQYDKDYPDSEEFLAFYFPTQGHENPDNYPYVTIIDPRTGEQVKVWCGRPFPKASDFHAELAEFLDRYSLDKNSKNPVAQPAAKKPQPVDVDRMTEDEMLEMALKNSLAGQANSSRSGSTPNIHDPDALTKPSDDEGKGKEPEVVEQSAWAKISSTNPHTEPDNDPVATTIIQFRHPTGRVVRRFRLDDRVLRMYEWLKAEPLEGKEGVEFELRRMPQGQDLVESLGSTIEEAGLKRAAVMIEFNED